MKNLLLLFVILIGLTATAQDDIEPLFTNEYTYVVLNEMGDNGKIAETTLVTGTLVFEIYKNITSMHYKGDSNSYFMLEFLKKTKDGGVLYTASKESGQDGTVLVYRDIIYIRINNKHFQLEISELNSNYDEFNETGKSAGRLLVRK